jgi:hypothetical protein
MPSISTISTIKKLLVSVDGAVMPPEDVSYWSVRIANQYSVTLTFPAPPSSELSEPVERQTAQPQRMPLGDRTSDVYILLSKNATSEATANIFKLVQQYAANVGYDRELARYFTNVYAIGFDRATNEEFEAFGILHSNEQDDAEKIGAELETWLKTSISG